jgi:hypothetical protein
MFILDTGSEFFPSWIKKEVVKRFYLDYLLDE